MSRSNRKQSNVSLRKSSINSLRKFFRRGSTALIDLPFDTLVDMVREKVLLKVLDNKQLYDERDVVKLRVDEWLIKRFVLDRKDVEEAVDGLNECLLWRKQYGINDITNNFFPREFYEMGIISMGRDREGMTVIFFRLRYYETVNEWQDIILQWAAFLIHHLDQDSQESQFSFIIDMTGAGVSNFDLSFTTTMLNYLFKYYPLAIKFIWIYEPSWVTKPFISVLLRVVPEKYRNVIKIVDKKHTKDIMGTECLPVFMGGKFKAIVEVPPNTVSIEEVAKSNGLSLKAANNMREHYNKVMNTKTN